MRNNAIYFGLISATVLTTRGHKFQLPTINKRNFIVVRFSIICYFYDIVKNCDFVYLHYVYHVHMYDCHICKNFYLLTYILTYSLTTVEIVLIPTILPNVFSIM